VRGLKKLSRRPPRAIGVAFTTLPSGERPLNGEPNIIAGNSDAGKGTTIQSLG
jgi:hypothetical protein